MHNCPLRDLFTVFSSRIYDKGGNSHYLLFMSGLWLIIQALELCQCASNAHLKTLYIMHTMLYQNKSELSWRTCFIWTLLSSWCYLFFLPMLFRKHMQHSPILTVPALLINIELLILPYFLGQCDFFWIKNILNFIRGYNV